MLSERVILAEKPAVELSLTSRRPPFSGRAQRDYSDELFDAHDASFVSVTQQFNTTTSMGRLTLNVLLSFAQFEREVPF